MGDTGIAKRGLDGIRVVYSPCGYFLLDSTIVGVNWRVLGDNSGLYPIRQFAVCGQRA
jgi:hypothetical protein